MKLKPFMPEVQKIAYIGDNLMERCWLCPDEEISLFSKICFCETVIKKNCQAVFVRKTHEWVKISKMPISPGMNVF